jgi:endo-1,4-beta-xylanase
MNLKRNSPKSLIRLALVAFLAAGLTAGCSSSVEEDPDDDDQEEETTLRELADARGYRFGAAVDAAQLTTLGQYRTTVSDEFNTLTPGNALKFGPLRPSRQTFFWDNADAVVEFAEDNGMQIRGHVLLWHQQNPYWLTNGNYNRAQLMQIMREHIQTVVGRYRGRIARWDVVNEGVADDGSLRKTLWLNGIGPEYIEMAFEWAHESDPDALLYYNDYSAEGSGAKSDGVYDLVADLKDRAIPIHGVGMQMHFSTEYSPTGSDVRANMARLANLGLLVDVTEMDVRIPMPADASELAAQGEIYSSFLQICLDAPNCMSFTIWGFTDAYSWVPGTFPGYGAALIFDEDYEPKPAYFRIQDTLDPTN